MTGDPLREAAEARRQRQAETERRQAQAAQESRERAVVVEQHRAQARAMVKTFLSKMAAAGYPGAQAEWIGRGLIRRRVRCWDGWLSTDGEMVGIPLGSHGRAETKRVTSLDEWLPRRIDDIYHRAMGSTSASTTPVEYQLKSLAENLDRILATNGIEV